ncbi:hypothetical protein ILUMI_07269 [Ignelater luminosus]|uniref:Uncharacterized protein n=1 Tax=Ignelater luminosus TaxID=2038154 RepID=A0A8K0D8F4_IGNLU|nr:hypothetical protein ILUMI_07269 [Ignelater luminosus]
MLALQDKNIEHDPSLTKPELYEIIKQNKSKNITYKIDHLVEQYKKIWALVKNWVASRNVTFKLNDVANLAREKLEAVGVAQWSKICEHIEKTENGYIYRKSIFLDNAFDRLAFIVNTGEFDESAFDESEDSSYEENDDIDGVFAPIPSRGVLADFYINILPTAGQKYKHTSPCDMIPLPKLSVKKEIFR